MQKQSKNDSHIIPYHEMHARRGYQADAAQVHMRCDCNSIFRERFVKEKFIP